MYGMRRIILLAVALLTAATATAINTRIQPLRIALLDQAPQYDEFRDRLKRELQALGYDAVETTGTIKDLGAERVPADYYVEILGAGGSSRPVAGIGAGPVDLGVSVNHVAASVNIYDGRTLDLIEAIDLHKRSTTVTPTGIIIGTRPVWAAVTLPFFDWAQYRGAMRRLAHDTAHDIDRALHR